MNGADVLAKVIDAQWIDHAIVRRCERIGKSGSILGDVDRGIAVAFLDPDEDVRQSLREHFPSRFCVDRAGLSHRRCPEWPCAWIEARDVARVVVDADEVERLTYRFEVGGRPRRPRFTEDLLELVRITAVHDRLEVLAVYVRLGAPRGRTNRCFVGGRTFQ